jgi:hypothetical protein
MTQLNRKPDQKHDALATLVQQSWMVLSFLESEPPGKRTGLGHSDMLPEGTTIEANWYVTCDDCVGCICVACRHSR